MARASRSSTARPNACSIPCLYQANGWCFTRPPQGRSTRPRRFSRIGLRTVAIWPARGTIRMDFARPRRGFWQHLRKRRFEMRHCRLCHADRLRPVIDLGAMPIAHRMLKTHDQSEERFPFAVTVCEACGLQQIAEPIDPDILYRDFNFNFSSWKVEPHEPDELDTIHSFTKPEKVFEIGCNDGRFMDEL